MNDQYKNLSQTILDHFQIKVHHSHNAHLTVVQEIDPLQEIELQITMKIFTNSILSSITVMKVLIYVSQYNFYP